MSRNNLLLIVGVIVVAAVIIFNLDMEVADKEETVSLKPAVVFDMGGKFDKSFNEGVWNGVKKFTEETGIEVM